MITIEMIANGFKKGIISIEKECGGCLGICCRIKDNAFYFLGDKEEPLTKEEYWKKYTLDMTVHMIFEILKSNESAEENGIDYLELAYYEAVLR